MRTLKEERVRINEFTSLSSFLEAQDGLIDGYNAYYLHSALGYRSQDAFEAEKLGRETLLTEAC
ncbi:MAG: hypothetical protein HY795_11630 [Desulfovibrio sp.]|nr:hypothetical protein [Desulfovibrio sp.]MBI4958964.1 hypothetical protein [Desulfovibrio sp.]